MSDLTLIRINPFLFIKFGRLFIFIMLSGNLWGNAYQEGLKAYQMGDLEEAALKFGEAQLETPESFELFFNLGSVKYQQGNFEAAETLFKKSLLTSSIELEAAAHYNLGNVAYRKGQFEASLEHYKKSLGILPENPDAQYNLEWVQLKIKELMDKQKNQPPNEKPQASGGEDGEKQNTPPGLGQDKKPDDQKPGDKKPKNQQGESKRSKDKGTPGENQGDQNDKDKNTDPSKKEDPKDAVNKTDPKDDEKMDPSEASSGEKPPATPAEAKDELKENESQGTPENKGDKKNEKALDYKELVNNENDEKPSPDQKGKTMGKKTLSPEEAKRLLKQIQDEEQEKRKARAKHQEMAARKSGQVAGVFQDW